MTDYEMFMKILTAWIEPSRDDVNVFYIDNKGQKGNHWVTVMGDNNQEIEFDFNADGKITGWY